MAKPRKARYYREAKDAGLCGRCQRAPRDGDYAYCTACRVVASERKRTDEVRAKHRVYSAKWRAENPQKATQRTKDYIRRLRNKIVDKYGGACACCGETERAFLAIDHVNRDGKRHRDEYPRNMQGYLMSIFRGTGDYVIQILCGNCHLAKDYRGGCPHQLQQ